MIRVAVGASEPGVRAGLEALIRNEPTLALVDESEADVIVTDATTPRIIAALATAAARLDARAGDVLEPVLAPATDAATEALTQREREILRLVAAGLPNKTIAARLQLSEHTVKFHLASIFSKLGATSRTEAVTRGIQLGLVMV